MGQRQKVIRVLATSDIAFDQRMLKTCTSLSKAYEVHIYSKGLIEHKSFLSHKIPLIIEQGFLFYAWFNFYLFFKLLFKKTDVILAVDLDSIPSAYLLSKLKNTSLVYDAHEFYVESPELDHRPFVKWFWEKIANFCLPRIKYNYTVCQSLVDILGEKYRTKYELIQNVPFKQKLVSRDFKDRLEGPILYQGVLNIGRGLEELIMAMPMIDKELWICGDGDISHQLKDLVSKLNLEDKVLFKGKVKPHQLKEITKVACLGINLLDGKNKNYYYSLANKHFDYMHAAVPIIGMRFPEYIRINSTYEVAVLLENLDIPNIQNNINDLLNDHKRYHLLHSNCLKSKELFSWQNEELKLLDFYKSID